MHDRIRAFQSLLYRRLCRLFPAQMNIVGKLDVFLDSKYALFNFAEIFASRTYYPAIELLTQPPRSVLDLGAHEGFFTLLAEANMRQRFPNAKAEYTLYEANPKLIRKIKRNLNFAGLHEHVRIYCGAVGKRLGIVDFGICKNLIMSSTAPIDRVIKRVKATYLDIEKNLMADGLDIPELIKADIEGSEADLFESYLDLFQRTCVVVVEYHRHAIPYDRWRHIVKKTGLILYEVTAESGTTVTEILINSQNLHIHNSRRLHHAANI